MRLYAMTFIECCFKPSAQITLVLDNGNIIYEGIAENIKPEMVTGLYVKSINGIGSLNDIVITLTAE